MSSKSTSSHKRQRISEESKTEGQTWVLPVDGSKHNSKAFEWVARNIHTNDTLHIITVIEEVHPDLPNTEYFNNMAKSINAELHTKGEARLQAYAQQAKEHGINHKCLAITAGSAKLAICDYVATVGADNLVMTRRGLSEGEKMILGSTSDYCIKHAYATVTIVKQ